MVKMKIRGHRGAAALEPENTIRSFQRALDEGVYAVEFDVRRTRDEELVVIHDETLDRTTDGTGPVRDHTIGQIQELDAGNGEHVPSLQETLTYFSEQGDTVQELRLEIKEEDTVQQAYEHVMDSGLFDKTVFHSFSLAALHNLKEIDSDTRTSATVTEPDGFLEDARAAGCEIVTLHYGHTTEDYLNKAKDYRFQTDLWAVKEEDAIRGAYRLQPDYVGADDPSLTKQVLKTLENTYQHAEDYV